MELKNCIRFGFSETLGDFGSDTIDKILGERGELL